VLREAFKCTRTAQELDQALGPQLQKFGTLFLATGNNLKELTAKYEQEKQALDREQRQQIETRRKQVQAAKPSPPAPVTPGTGGAKKAGKTTSKPSATPAPSDRPPAASEGEGPAVSAGASTEPSPDSGTAPPVASEPKPLSLFPDNE
jgi:hypothetical protein